MRRNREAPTVVFSCHIRQETLDKFKALYPAQGARVWAVITGLEIFLDVVESSPRFQRIVHEAIQGQRVQGPPKGLIASNVRVPTSLYNKFYSLFPEVGAQTWFFRTFMDKLVEYMIEHNIDLNNIIEVSVRNMLAAKE